MIVVDTSALVAVVFDEPERLAFVQCMERSAKVLISTVSAVEARMVVMSRQGPRGVVILDDLLGLALFEMQPVGRAEMDAAYAAFVAYCRGSGHPAGLNFGDLFSYALAKLRGLPLLYKGDDFARTDIRTAWPDPEALSLRLERRSRTSNAPGRIRLAPRQRSARRAGSRNRRPASTARR